MKGFITISDNKENHARCSVCLERENLYDVEFTWMNQTNLNKLCSNHLVELRDKIHEHLL